MRVGGIVLCGGEGRRLGRPKAWLTIGTETFLSRAVCVMQRVVQPVAVAGRIGQPLPPLPPDVNVVRDVVPHGGPVSGLAAGFAALRRSCDAAVVMACDHPLVTPEFLRRLVDLLGDGPGIVPVSKGRTYPLLAVYRLDTEGVLMDMLRTGVTPGAAFSSRDGEPSVEGTRDGDASRSMATDRGSESACRKSERQSSLPILSVRGFAARCGAREVSASELRDVDPNLNSLINVNDWETYHRVVSG